MRWVKIAGHPGYEVSDEGQVRSWRKPGPNKEARLAAPRMLSPTALPAGHLYVALNGGKKEYIHCLVLEAFEGPCPEGMEACHEDDDPSNNSLDNLRWGSREENMEDRRRNGRLNLGEKNGSAVLSDDDVSEIRARYARGGVSQSSLAREFSVHQSLISRIVNRRVRA